jgi:hypothetical protein
LSTEHRAADSQDHIHLQLTQTGSALALCVSSDSSIDEPDSEPSALSELASFGYTLSEKYRPFNVNIGIPLEELVSLGSKKNKNTFASWISRTFSPPEGLAYEEQKRPGNPPELANQKQFAMTPDSACACSRTRGECHPKLE